MKKITLFSLTLCTIPLFGAEFRSSKKPAQIECLKKDISPLHIVTTQLITKTGLYKNRYYRLIKSVTPVIKKTISKKINEFKTKIKQKIQS